MSQTNESSRSRQAPLGPVLLFWIGYLAITFLVGFVTSKAIASEVWQLTAWGFISSVGLLGLARGLQRRGATHEHTRGHGARASSLKRFSVGLLIGAASFGAHLLVVATVGGPIRLELEPEIAALPAFVYFARFLSTSCMEEIGFRGFSLQRLQARFGSWAAVWVTSIVFGLSHLSYGWDMTTIALGVIPGGLLWGMSAVATRGLAVPIGLHAAWNFASWCAGSRAETGLLSMVVEDDALERTQTVGTVSYLATFGALTIAFWFVHRRNLERARVATR